MFCLVHCVDSLDTAGQTEQILSSYRIVSYFSADLCILQCNVWRAVDDRMRVTFNVCVLSPVQNCVANDVKQIHCDTTDSSADACNGSALDADIPHTPVSSCIHMLNKFTALF